MSIASISFNFFSQVAPAPSSVPAAPAAGPAPAPAPQSCEPHGHQGRRNVLYEAMMAALRELGLTAAPQQPAPTSPAAAPGAAPLPAPAPAPVVAVVTTAGPAPVAGAPAVAPAAGTPPATSVEDAVFAFAHALWQAVRGGDSDGSRRERRGDDDHEGRHGHRRHGHGHEHGYGMARGYTGLATRLEALAVRVDSSTTPASPSPVVDSGVTPAPTPAPVAVPAVQSEVAPAPATTPAAAVAAPSPLAQAFDAMMRVLRAINPNAPSADAGAPSLASFLHSLARGLDSDRSTPPMSGVGIAINIHA